MCSCFSKTYKYKTHADIFNLSSDDILSILPNDVDSNILNETGGVLLPE